MKKNKGMTLMELIVVIVLIGILIPVIYPIFNIIPTIYYNIQRLSHDSQEAANFYSYMDNLFKNNAEIITTGSYYLEFKSGNDFYILNLDKNANDAPPYAITLQKNNEPARPLAEGITRLASPKKPGLELEYLDNTGAPSMTTANVQIIKATLHFQGSAMPYIFRSAWHLDQTSLELK